MNKLLSNSKDVLSEKLLAGALHGDP